MSLSETPEHRAMGASVYSGRTGRGSQLCVGAVSRNVIDAAIDLAYATPVQIAVIASRSQVEQRSLGGGYLAGWSMTDLVAYVRSRDPRHLVAVGRDHGGPWRHPNEQELAPDQAIKAAVASLAADVDAGVDLLHIDASPPAHLAISHDAALETYVEIVRRLAERKPLFWKKPLRVEASFTSERSSPLPTDEVQRLVAVLKHSLRRNELSCPDLLSLPVGTAVSGARNTGLLVSPASRRETFRTLQQTTELLQRMSLPLKAHNCDYLPAGLWATIAPVVDHVNVAPEYGVTESRALVSLLLDLGLRSASTRFLEIAYESGRWKKWLHFGERLSERDLGLLAGHYVFGSKEVADIRNRAAKRMGTVGQLDQYLRDTIKQVMGRHVSALAPH